jgi:hypothetical protein
MKWSNSSWGVGPVFRSVKFLIMRDWRGWSSQSNLVESQIPRWFSNGFGIPGASKHVEMTNESLSGFTN